MITRKKNVLGTYKILTLCMVFTLGIFFLYSYYENNQLFNATKVVVDKHQYRINETVNLSIKNNVDESSMLIVYTPLGQVYSNHLILYPHNIIPDNFKIDEDFFLKCHCSPTGVWSIKHMNHSGVELDVVNFLVSD